MGSRLDAASIARFHDRQLRERDWPILTHASVQAGAWEWIAANHRYNGLQWNEEERARRLDLPPADIAAGRRLADHYRHKRAAAARAIDETLLAAFAAIVSRPRAHGAGAAGDASGCAPGDVLRYAPDYAQGGASDRAPDYAPGDAPDYAAGDASGDTSRDESGGALGETPGAMIDGMSLLALHIHHMRAHAQRTGAGVEHVHACNGRLKRLAAQRDGLMARLDVLFRDVRRGRACFTACRGPGVADGSAAGPRSGGGAPDEGQAAP